VHDRGDLAARSPLARRLAQFAFLGSPAVRSEIHDIAWPHAPNVAPPTGEEAPG